MQAAKTGLAVAIAWMLAPYLPGVADNYPYYAPLGAIVAMYPTLMGSMKNAAQTLGSLAVAIALAGAVINFSSPSVLTMSLAVGLGALIAATGWPTGQPANFSGAHPQRGRSTTLEFPSCACRSPR